MSVPVAPARGEADPAPLEPRDALAVAGASLLAALLFWSPLLLGGALAGGDWASHHFHYFDWVRVSLTEHGTLPLFMSDAWVTPNFLGNAEAPTLGPFAWLLAVLPTGVYVKGLIVGVHRRRAWPADGSCWRASSAVATPRGRRSPPLVFACSGFFVVARLRGAPLGDGRLPAPAAGAGSSVAPRGGAAAALVAAAALNAFTIMGGQHQPFIWQNLFARRASPCLWAAARVGALFPLTAPGVECWLLSRRPRCGEARCRSGLEFGDYAPTARIQSGFRWARCSPTLAGQRPAAPTSVDPSRRVQRGRAGWWEYGFYIGPVGAGGCSCVGVRGVASRSTWPLARARRGSSLVV